MTKIVSFLNIKGGVGKTSSVVNIGAVLANKGYRTLIIDTDSQANATRYLGREGNTQNSVYSILANGKGDYVKTDYENLYLMPSNMKLLGIQGTAPDGIVEFMLTNWITDIKDNFDYILIDCPPSLNNCTLNTLIASTHVFVPMKIDQFSADGLSYLLSTVDQIGKLYNPEVKMVGIFITMDRATTLNKQKKKELREVLGNRILNQTIRENVSLTKSTFEQKPVVYLDRKAASSRDYRKLTEEILDVLARWYS